MSSLFSNFTPGYKPAASVFPAPSTSAPNVFGNKEATTTQQSSTPSLFGTAQPSAGNSGSLFSNAGQQKPSLFGNTGAAGNSQTNTGGASMFGGLASTSQPAGTATGPTGGFSTTNQGMNASTNQTTQQGQDGQVKQPQPLYFDQLIERGKKRQDRDEPSSLGAFGELPSLQLGLGDIAKKVRGLGQTNTDSRAHYLLAASGVKTGAALRDLSSFSADAAAKAPVTAPTISPFDADLDTYVDGLYRESTLNLIEQGLEQAKRDFDTFLEENVQMEWDAQRRRIYEHFGLVKKGEDAEATFDGTASNAARGAFGRSSRRGRTLGASAARASFGASNMNKSVLGATGRQTSRQSLFPDVAEKAPAGLQPAPEDRMLREKQDRYAAKVKELNIRRLEERLYPLLTNFAEVEAQPSLEDTSNLVNAYKALVEIVGENPDLQNPSDPGAVRERQFARDYLDDAPNSRNAFALRKRIIEGSRRFLEKLFLSQLETTIVKNAKEASLGGVPSDINKVRAYVRLRAARKELGADNIVLQQNEASKDYPWVIIFYLLRAGLVNEAVKYIDENSTDFKNMDRNFPTYLAQYARSPDRRLTPDLQNRITMAYSQRANAPQNDPYRMACYKIIGRCELGRRTLENVSQNMEDWVWLQFVLAREVNRVEETAAEVFGLEDVRAVIHEVGQRHFAQGTEGAAGYGTYFFLQILAGQFESAVAWLYPNNYLSAVHFAIALNYYGLLRVNDFNSVDDLLSYTTNQKPQISFGHLIGYYTRDFRASKTTVAADYLTLICLNGDIADETGKRQVQLCHEALRELVLETREFAQLLGDIRADGQRIQGSIEQRLKLIRIGDQESFLRHITISAAQIADDNGRVTDAVLLYHLAEEYDNVISICNKALSDAIAVEMGDPPLRLEPLKPRDPKERQMAAEVAPAPTASLSLTAVEDPYQLTRNMSELYDSNTLNASRIKPLNREACTLLLGMAIAKAQVQASRWANALDTLNSLNLLPISARGNIAAIRSHATAFSALPPVVARNIGNLLIWAITCCGHQREILRSSMGFEEKGREKVAEDILQVAKDVMVFAGLIRYKLQPRVFEVLARVGGDVGAY